MRKHFEMSEEQLEGLMNASKPTRVMYLPGGTIIGRTPQENANFAWENLGEEMGFKHMTVQPVKGMSGRFFTAEVEELTK